MKRTALLGVSFAVLLVCGLSFLTTTFFSVAKASTSVNSIIITSDTKWTKANSPYALSGPVAVSRGATLTIEPGVTVNLGRYYLQVNGTLRAQGTSVDNIIFNFESPGEAPYGQIVFNDESNDWNETTCSGSIIENAVIKFNLIFIHACSPKISNNSINGFEFYFAESSSVISNNTINAWLYLAGSSALVVGNTCHYQSRVIDTISDRSIISNNLIIGGETGIYSRGDTYNKMNTVYGNTVTDCDVGIDSFESVVAHNLIINNGRGILDHGMSVVQNNTVTNNAVGFYSYTLSDSPSTIVYNNILNNSQYNLQLDQFSKDNVNATYNWWGTTDSHEISQKIRDNKLDFNLPKVSFEPFLTRD